jgi:methyl-accepting chemotaxis protein
VEIQKAILYIALGVGTVLLCLLCYCAGNNNRSADMERLEQQATEYLGTISKLTDTVTNLNSRLTEFAREYSSLIDTIRKIKEGSGRVTEDIQRAAELNSDIIKSIRELQEASRRYIEETGKGSKTIPNRVHNLRKPSGS